MTETHQGDEKEDTDAESATMTRMLVKMRMRHR